jgi:hypothetical protein
VREPVEVVGELGLKGWNHPKAIFVFWSFVVAFHLFCTMWVTLLVHDYHHIPVKIRVQYFDGLFICLLPLAVSWQWMHIQYTMDLVRVINYVKHSMR